MLTKFLKLGVVVSVATTVVFAKPEKTDLNIGFIALTDCAPIVIAQEKGFFKKYGLNVHVIKEGGGWPGIQQKVISGEYDFSHALAGMPIAATLGINGDANLQALCLWTLMVMPLLMVTTLLKRWKNMDWTKQHDL